MDDMNHPQPEKPAELKIDVEQWRGDIQTFVETTNRALDAIAAELSNGCSSRFDETAINPRSQTGETRSVLGADKTSVDDRLSRLKTQIAERISKSN
jgi:hypothetical protein